MAFESIEQRLAGLTSRVQALEQLLDRAERAPAKAASAFGKVRDRLDGIGLALDEIAGDIRRRLDSAGCPPWPVTEGSDRA